MNTKIIVALAACVILSGCATVGDFVERHPVATAVGVAVIAGSIAEIAELHHRRMPVQKTALVCGPPTDVLHYQGGPTC